MFENKDNCLLVKYYEYDDAWTPFYSRKHPKPIDYNLILCGEDRDNFEKEAEDFITRNVNATTLQEVENQVMPDIKKLMRKFSAKDMRVNLPHINISLQSDYDRNDVSVKIEPSSDIFLDYEWEPTKGSELEKQYEYLEDTI